MLKHKQGGKINSLETYECKYCKQKFRLMLTLLTHEKQCKFKGLEIFTQSTLLQYHNIYKLLLFKLDMKNKYLSRSVRISNKLWKKLMRLKLDFNCKSIDELLERMLKDWKGVTKK